MLRVRFCKLRRLLPLIRLRQLQLKKGKTMNKVIEHFNAHTGVNWKWERVSPSTIRVGDFIAPQFQYGHNFEVIEIVSLRKNWLGFVTRNGQTLAFERRNRVVRGVAGCECMTCSNGSGL